MRAGELRHRVEIQTRAAGVSGTGAPSGGWEEVATVWAQVSPGKGDKTAVPEGVLPSQAARVRIRYRTDVDESCRVLFGGRFYEVVSAMNWEERGIYLDLQCTVRAMPGDRA